MTEYKVYQNTEGDLHKVKIGFSFPAFFFTWGWMLFSKLWDIFVIWVIAILVYSIFSEIVFMISGYIWIGGIALGLIPGIYGNGWIERRLKKSGYHLIHDTRFVKKTDIDEPKGSLIGEVWQGNISIVLRMIEAGADINHTNQAGQTALDAASIRGDTPIMLTLLSKGATGRLS